MVDRLFKINIHALRYAAVETARQMPDVGRIPIPGTTIYAVSESVFGHKIINAFLYPSSNYLPDGARAMTLISKSKPANQFTPIAVHVG